MIFQDPMTSLNPVHSIGRQLVETVLLHHDISKKEARARAIEALKEVGIPRAETRIDDYPHQFSGGMRQRVMIAMAMINDPRLLIADEPTTALDVTTQAQILEVMQKLQADHGTAIVMITHDLGVVAETADDVVVMYAAKVVEHGSVDAIFKDPQHPYTWGLLGSLPRLDTDVERLTQIPGQPPSLLNPPQGCRFNPRCPYVMDVCKQKEPELLPVVRRARAHAGMLPRRGDEGARGRAAQGDRDARRRVLMADDLLVVEELKKHFPVTRGIIFKKQIGAVKAVDGVSFTPEGGRDARRRRRVRLRQVDDGALHHEAARSDGRQGHLQGPRHLEPLAQRDAPAPARDDDGLPGSVRVAQRAQAGRLHRRRGDSTSTGSARRPSGSAASASCSRSSG